MKLMLRVLVLLIVIPPLYFILSYMFLITFKVTPGLEGSSFVLWGIQLFAAIVIVPIGYFVLKGVDKISEGFRTAVSTGEFFVGSAGFMIGNVMTEIYMPDNEQSILGAVIN